MTAMLSEHAGTHIRVNQLERVARRLAAMIHRRPQAAVLEVAGAGTLAIAWLHAEAGSSTTVLEATDRYSLASLQGLLGAAPPSVVADEVAARMADLALARAAFLRPESPPVGIGCTASITTARPQRGQRRAVISVATPLGRQTLRVALDAPEGPGAREEEEAVVSLCVVALLADAAGIAATTGILVAANIEADLEFLPEPGLAALFDGSRQAIFVPPGAVGDAVEPAASVGSFDGVAVLSGSFNPLHDAHLALGAVAGEQLGRIVYELPVVNAEKAPLNPTEAWRRAAQFAGRAGLLLSRAPLFHHKAALYPGATFVIGVDTAQRLVAPRFYGGQVADMLEALQSIANAGCGFLVACRRADGALLELADVSVPPQFRALFIAIPSDRFAFDLSSTDEREAERAVWAGLLQA